MLVLYLLLLLLHFCSALPLRDFYPFGAGTTDSNLTSNDDRSSRIQISTIFPFFGVGHTTVFVSDCWDSKTWNHGCKYTHWTQVNNNGLVSFGESVSTYTPDVFPLRNSSLQLIAPFWADVDTRRTGTVWFRETSNATVLNRVKRDVQMAFTDQASFLPQFAVVVTWDRVGFFSAHYDLVSTFRYCSTVYAVSYTHLTLPTNREV